MSKSRYYQEDFRKSNGVNEVIRVNGAIRVIGAKGVIEVGKKVITSVKVGTNRQILEKVGTSVEVGSNKIVI